MASRRDRERKPGRRVPFREPKSTILIVCEGSVTEPEYFNSFKRICKNSRVTIQIAGGQGVPLTVVRKAKELKDAVARRAKQERDENIAFDSVWCVYDIDNHPHHHEAREMAIANDINLAISNPCFELWLLLHFRDNPGAIDTADLRSMLKQFDPDYDKHVSHSNYIEQYDNAFVRAKRMEETAVARGEAGGNPSTAVYKLTAAIRDR
jgi:hypothetical protein